VRQFAHAIQTLGNAGVKLIAQQAVGVELFNDDLALIITDREIRDTRCKRANNAVATEDLWIGIQRAIFRFGI
jgi:hypothetical protein